MVMTSLRFSDLTGDGLAEFLSTSPVKMFFLTFYPNDDGFLEVPLKRTVMDLSRFFLT